MTSEGGERVQLEARIALNGAGRVKRAWKARIALSRPQELRIYRIKESGHGTNTENGQF